MSSSRSHEELGFYGQGVGLTTAILPGGWRERLVAFDDPEAGASRPLCLYPYDLVVSKLVAGREKDLLFARALLDARLIRAEVLAKRRGSSKDLRRSGNESSDGSRAVRSPEPPVRRRTKA